LQGQIPTMDFDEIFPSLLLGSCPKSTEHIDRLKHDASVTAVLSLQTEEDFDYLNLDWNRLQAHYQELGIELRRVPVRDFDQDDLRENLPDCVEALGRLLDDDHTVYVHCNLGIGRSPSVVIAYLHWVRRWDLDEAFDHVTGCRACSPNLDAIRLAGEDRLNRRDADH